MWVVWCLLRIKDQNWLIVALLLTARSMSCFHVLVLRSNSSPASCNDENIQQIAKKDLPNANCTALVVPKKVSKPLVSTYS